MHEFVNNRELGVKKKAKPTNHIGEDIGIKIEECDNSLDYGLVKDEMVNENTKGSTSEDSIKKEEREKSLDYGLKDEIVENENTKEFRKFSCKFCNYKARLAHTLKVHIEMNHIKLRFVCKVCNYNSCERYTLKHHLRDKHSVDLNESDNKTSLECGVCLSSTKVDEFKSHLDQNHPIYYEAYNLVSPDENIVVKCPENDVCEFCGEDFSGKRQKLLWGHIAAAHMQMKYKCTLCTFESKKKLLTYNHIGNKHDNVHHSALELKRFKRNSFRYKCVNCTFEATKNFEMLDHIKLQHEETLKTNLLSCDQCDVVKGSQKMLTIHKNKIHTNGEEIVSKKKIKCSKCAYKSLNVLQMADHIGRHLKVKFSCDLCEEKFQNRNLVVFHIREEHNEMFQSNDKILVHTYITCYCPECKFLGPSRDFDLHLQNCHNLPSAKIRTTKLDPSKVEIFSCADCDRRYASKFSLIIHVSKFHLKLFYTCDVCEIRIDSLVNIKEHMLKMHIPESDKSTTCCSECQIIMKDDLKFKHVFEAHGKYMKTSTVSKEELKNLKKDKQIFQRNKGMLLSNRIQCLFCKSHLTEKETYKHMISYHLKTNFACPPCGFSTVGRPLMLKHIKSVHQERDISSSTYVQLLCGLCSFQAGESFFMKHIVQHEELEQEHSLHSCTVCDYKHVSRTRLESHCVKEKHTIQILNCELCEYKTSKSWHLVTHVKQSHRDFQYTCPLCLFKSVHTASIKRHIESIHDQEKLHQCILCPNRYKRNEFLQVHIRAKH